MAKVLADDGEVNATGPVITVNNDGSYTVQKRSIDVNGPGIAHKGLHRVLEGREDPDVYYNMRTEKVDARANKVLCGCYTGILGLLLRIFSRASRDLVFYCFFLPSHTSFAFFLPV